MDWIFFTPTGATTRYLLHLFIYFGFLRKGFSIALEPVLDWLVDQAGLELSLPLVGIKASPADTVVFILK